MDIEIKNYDKSTGERNHDQKLNLKGKKHRSRRLTVTTKKECAEGYSMKTLGSCWVCLVG
jgi:hypothetical protein